MSTVGGLVGNSTFAVGHERAMDLDDAALWSRARGGDADAFGVLFERHARAIYNYCFRRVGDWAAAEDRSAKRRLRRSASSPAWSPDGRKLAFVGWHGDVHRGYDGSDIYVASVGGGGLRKLPHAAWAGDPVWSRDGRQIAFNSGWTLGEIYLMNADGSGRRRVVAAGNPAIGRFSWSPDGQSIAFERADGPHYPRIYVMAADGSGTRWLADGTRPLWSPRGGVIAFVAATDRCGAARR